MAVIHVPMSEAAPVIRELLEAAQRLGLDPSVVKTSTDGFFGFSLLVPDEVDDMAAQIRIERAATPKKPEDFGQEPASEPEPAPKKKGGRPRKAAAEPVVEEEQE
jgi:hypothetical protein